MPVFVAWDMTVPNLRSKLADLVDMANDEHGIRVGLLGLDEQAQTVIPSEVERAVRSTEAMLVLLDRANVNVAYELGLGLARPELRLALACVGSEPPSWLGQAPLLASHVPREQKRIGQLLSLVNRLAQGSAEDLCYLRPPSDRPLRGSQTLLLCPKSVGNGEGFAWRLKDLALEQPRWSGSSLDHLPRLLDGVGRVILVLPQPDDDDDRDGDESARMAVLFGYARGLALSDHPIEVHALVERGGRVFADLLATTTTVQDSKAALAWVQDLGTVGQAITRDPLAAYRRWVLRQHAEVALFDPGVGEVATQRVQVGWEHAARLPIGCPTQEGTLSQLLRQSCDAGQPGRWLIAAEPGAGKTTALRQVAWEQASSEGACVVVLPWHEWMADGEPDPFRFAETLSRTPGLADALRAEARTPGAVWLLLDGLDEVADHKIPDALRRMVDLGEDTDWAGVAIVASTRKIVLERCRVPERFIVAELRALDDNQQEDLLRTLCGGHADELWEIVGRGGPLRELLRNPLMMTLYALTGVAMLEGHIEGVAAGLAPDRVELYQRAVQLLLRRGRGDKAQPVKNWKAAQHVLAELSFRLQQGGGEAWSEGELLEALSLVQDAGARGAKELARAWRGNAADFLADLQRCALVGPRDGQGSRWRYMHRSLREYLAAVALRDGGEAAEGCWLERWGSAEGDDAARWGEVYLLRCGLKPGGDETLERLGAVSPELFVRAVKTMDGWSPEQVVAGLWPLEVRRLGGDGHWDGDDLELALTRTGAGAAVLQRVLGEVVRWERRTERLGILYVALERLVGEVDADAFFRGCERPRPREADPAELIPPASSTDAGSFLMGSPEDVGGPDEHPQHAVRMTPFRLGHSTVTRAQYQRFDPEHTCPGGDEHPVTMVSWYEARLYAAWVGGTLPTEGQWEYACRAPRHAEDSTAWWCGDEEEQLAEVAWYGENSGGEVQPVGADGHANRWGLHDMHGNVWEWCQDGRRDYALEPEHDPVGPPHGRRVFRGGVAWNDADWCRSAYRSGRSPWIRDVSVGFRVRWPSPAGEP